MLANTPPPQPPTTASRLLPPARPTNSQSLPPFHAIVSPPGLAYSVTLPPPFDTIVHSHKKKLGSQNVLGCPLIVEKGGLGDHLNRCSAIENTVKLKKIPSISCLGETSVQLHKTHVLSIRITKPNGIFQIPFLMSTCSLREIINQISLLYIY